ncbi:MAG: bifunctional phosphoribosyl-AMP cyclohydrolase/phosphoribosyl-ATP diphosphatase HisIE [Lachnospiraceae bacterium]|nr:bifunctional phosphoribosyl-AMP cyclohydrolase/phosphoribosyl-ATP diphosphatase HisIE [Lachnospiraceae bacterium]
MSENKKFYPCIFLNHRNACVGFTDDTTVDEDPVRLAKRYCSGHADGLIVFDQSRGDREHDAAIDIIRVICEEVKVPVIAAGNVRRLEDVKKLLYAGCSMAALNFSRQDNIDLAQEAAARFGRERIAACYRATDAITENRELICNNISQMILVDEKVIPEALQIREVPIILSLPDVSLDKIMEFFSHENVTGITGNAVNENVDELLSIKQLLVENGVSVQIRKAAFGWEDFRKNADGLLPVVVQEDATDEVLMVAYMNQEAYETTIRTGRMTYFSRSRQQLWVKGETSGHFQYVRSLYGDCDMDTLLARVDQVGAACHTGHHSCFFQEDLPDQAGVRNNPQKVLQQVYEVIADRKRHPKEGSYTNYLFDKGIDKILKKLGEEATETVIAAKNPNPTETVYEMADYLYHMMVLMVEKGLTWEDITEELARRE